MYTEDSLRKLLQIINKEKQIKLRLLKPTKSCDVYRVVGPGLNPWRLEIGGSFRFIYNILLRDFGFVCFGGGGI